MNHATNYESIRTYQRRRCCAFDSPGLPNDSAGYPGLVYVVRGTTP
ncbi:DNA-directed RNA polymerase [Segatella salivae]|nr:DNA-directed RNA polymerase [Segatella salivae]MBF1556160.1 DNA-directed RNA polymerase [Segatella salivae]